MKYLPNDNPARDELRPQRMQHKLAFTARIMRVPDGDTLIVVRCELGGGGASTEVIRLAGIDAAEMAGPDQIAATRAQLALARICAGEIAVVIPTRIWRDPYNRIIARVIARGVDLGAEMVRQGWAVHRPSSHVLRSASTHRQKFEDVGDPVGQIDLIM